jgi:hypothetical protein
MKDELRSPLKHEHEHAVPTVIHHPEEDLPLLARWLQRAMVNQTRFWSLLIGLVVVVVGLTLLSRGLSNGRAASDEAWTELDAAKTAADRVEIANKYPNTSAERWALLQAAIEYYNTGFADLPANRDAALPQLKLALKYFEQVAKESPKDAPQARAAAFGVARTHEARNEIEKAVEQYESVAKTWPDSEEGRESKTLAEALRKPENVAFYKELYAFKPVEMTLPSMGQGSIPLPPGHPSVGPNSPFLLPPPPPSVDGTTKASPAPTPGLPDDVFAPSATAPEAKPATTPEAKPAATPETKPATAPETRPATTPVPDDVFAPSATTPETKKDEPKP